jgi:hypothetical protein
MTKDRGVKDDTKDFCQNNYKMIVLLPTEMWKAVLGKEVYQDHELGKAKINMIKDKSL